MFTTSKRLLVAAVAVLAVGACGTTNDSDSERPFSIGDVFGVGDQSRYLLQDAAEAAEAQHRADRCRRQVGPLLRELRSVDAQLAVGMTQTEYDSALDLVSMAYSSLDPEKLGFGCSVAVGVPLEAAFNRYVEANDMWSDCIWDLYSSCTTDSIEPDLQVKWEKANRKIELAGHGLEGMADAAWTPTNQNV